MPLLLVSYTLQFLDKQSLNFASIMGIIDDLVSIHRYRDTRRSLTREGPRWIKIQLVQQRLLLRLPCLQLPSVMANGPSAPWQVSRWIKVITRQSCTTLPLTYCSLAWAIILCCHAAVQTFPGLLVARFFLGVAEASISPGFSLITGMWYKREEQPFRHGIWFLGNAIATSFGGLLAYGIAHIGGALESWRVSAPICAE